MPHAFKTLPLIPKLSISLNKLLLLTCFLVIIYFAYARYEEHKTEQAAASLFVLSPQRNDIYFFDLGLLDDKSDLKNKYKLAKVVRVNSDNVAIVYGTFFYQWQSAVIKSIERGDLSNNDYFTLIPDYISFSKIKEMKNNGTIYLVKRPIQNILYGNIVIPE
ncbi:hypothetical protein [Colwellia psychrerythraea]|uniref:Uncharacterized protein n=1 Tax=Colwellia psychrerythraea TaxID=28229 RepID=A0A099KHK0_COLPS|nr:hypothetical protein [Colwellia psychrerythraea]KGJ89836.1 hypothetical protein GAB14E_3714 [Colwellia psychrerythraea]